MRKLKGLLGLVIFLGIGFFAAKAIAAPPYSLGGGFGLTYDLPAGVTGSANPTVLPSCDPLRITFVLDKSGSIDSTEADAMRTSVKGFIDSLSSNFPGGVKFNYVVFSNLAQAYPKQLNESVAGPEDRWLNAADAKNAITPGTGAISLWKGETGNISQIPYSMNPPFVETSNGSIYDGTNWDAAMQYAAGVNSISASSSYPTSSAVIMITDGDPTVSLYEMVASNSGSGVNYDAIIDGPGAGPDQSKQTVANSPLNGTAYSDVNSENYYELKMAVQASNILKAMNIPVYGFGVGVDGSNTSPVSGAAVSNIKEISGNTQGSDYFLSDFGQLGSSLNSLIPNFQAACVKPNVKVSKSLITSGDVNPGETIDWGIKVDNDSTVAANNVVVNDVLPSGWTVAPGSTFPAGTSLAGSTWTVGTLAAGASKELVLKVKIPDDAAMGTTCNSGDPNLFTNTANITADEDSNTADNTSSAKVCIKPINVKITKTLKTTGEIYPGSTIEWDITAENTTGGTAKNVVVNDVLPAGFTVDSATSTVPAGTSLSGTTWTVGTLTGNQSKVLTLKTKVPDDAPMALTCDSGAPNILTNKADISALRDQTASDNSDTATACIVPMHKELEKFFDVEPEVCDLDRAQWKNVPLAKGLSATELSLTNLAKIELIGLAKNDATLTSSSTDLTTPKEYAITDSTLDTSKLRLKVKYYYRPTLDARITRDLIGLDMSSIVTPEDNLVASKCPVDLTADKTSNFSTVADTAGVGSEFEYTLTFTNKGPNDAYNAKIVDTLPAGGEVELSGSNPFTYTTTPNSTTVTCTPSTGSTGFSCDVNKMISVTKDPAAKVEIRVKVKLTQEYLDNYLESDAYHDTNDFSLHAAMDVITNSVSIEPGIHPTTGEVQPDTDTSNNDDEVEDQPQAADIEVIKLISPIGGGGAYLLHQDDGTQGWTTPGERYVMPTGQVFISEDISPNVEGWDIQKVDYMIFVVNRGPDTQKGVAVQDTRTASDGNNPLTIDTGYRVLTKKLSPNPTYGVVDSQTVYIDGVTATTATIDWPVGDLAPGEAKGMFYRVNYSDNADTYSNMAENVTPGPDRDPDSDSSDCDAAAPTQDDCDTTNVTKNAGSLTITKDVSPSEVSSVDQPVTYTIVVKNNGSKDYATGEYSVTDTLPAGLDYVSSTPNGKCAYDSGPRLITCTDLGPLPAGDPLTGGGKGEVTIVVNAKANDEIKSQTDITNVACVVPTVPTMGTTDGKLCDEAEIVTKSVDLELTKTIVGSQGVYIGDEFQYEISLTNKGPGIAEDVVVKETYPPTVEFVSALAELGDYNSSTHEWTVPEIGVNQTVKLKVNVKALEYSDEDDRRNQAEVIACKQGDADCDDIDSTPGNCEDRTKNEDDCGEAEFHQPVHDIELTKTIVNQANSYKVGDTVEYLITLTNKGPDTAKNLVIKENMPAELEYLYHEAPAISTYDPATHEWIVRSITSGQSLELKLTARITKFASSLTNIAEWVGCKDASGKEVKCGKDPDSTPGNCDAAKNKEDDCGDTTIKLSSGGGGAGPGIGVPVTGALVGKIIAGATGISLAAYLGRDLVLRRQKKTNSER